MRVLPVILIFPVLSPFLHPERLQYDGAEEMSGHSQPARPALDLVRLDLGLRGLEELLQLLALLCAACTRRMSAYGEAHVRFSYSTPCRPSSNRSRSLTNFASGVCRSSYSRHRLRMRCEAGESAGSISVKKRSMAACANTQRDQQKMVKRPHHFSSLLLLIGDPIVRRNVAYLGFREVVNESEADAAGRGQFYYPQKRSRRTD